MTMLLIIVATITALPLLLATVVAVLARDPQWRADAHQVVMLLRCGQGKPKTRY
jgi:hypothetical protein